MKQNFFKITASHKFQAVVQFLRKELRWKATDPLVSIVSFVLLLYPKDFSPMFTDTFFTLVIVHVHQLVIRASTRRLGSCIVQGG